ncbi:hypothetical protein Dda_6779 [Drechslerella dactyloides]|uniref:Uncharacterized protein n=1 Tax=Drechslerella dactyloides TaxID=74499 RepID=A0AAD6NJ77_DREDA|nr:hypothetical protein Dda_6779 [Drechslerella dactyloides]
MGGPIHHAPPSPPTRSTPPPDLTENRRPRDGITTLYDREYNQRDFEDNIDPCISHLGAWQSSEPVQLDEMPKASPMDYPWLWPSLPDTYGFAGPPERYNLVACTSCVSGPRDHYNPIYSHQFGYELQYRPVVMPNHESWFEAPNNNPQPSSSTTADQYRYRPITENDLMDLRSHEQRFRSESQPVPRTSDPQSPPRSEPILREGHLSASDSELDSEQEEPSGGVALSSEDNLQSLSDDDTGAKYDYLVQRLEAMKIQEHPSPPKKQCQANDANTKLEPINTQSAYDLRPGARVSGLFKEALDVPARDPLHQSFDQCWGSAPEQPARPSSDFEPSTYSYKIGSFDEIYVSPKFQQPSTRTQISANSFDERHHILSDSCTALCDEDIYSKPYCCTTDWGHEEFPSQTVDADCISSEAVADSFFQTERGGHKERQGETADEETVRKCKEILSAALSTPSRVTKRNGSRISKTTPHMASKAAGPVPPSRIPVLWKMTLKERLTEKEKVTTETSVNEQGCDELQERPSPEQSDSAINVESPEDESQPQSSSDGVQVESRTSCIDPVTTALAQATICGEWPPAYPLDATAKKSDIWLDGSSDESPITGPVDDDWDVVSEWEAYEQDEKAFNDVKELDKARQAALDAAFENGLNGVEESLDFFRHWDPPLRPGPPTSDKP